jgi:hypothetical protein
MMAKRVAMSSMFFLTAAGRSASRVHMPVSRLTKSARNISKTIRPLRSRMDYINFNLREMEDRVNGKFVELPDDLHGDQLMKWLETR